MFEGLSREGFHVKSVQRPRGRFGWDCDCGANGEDYLDDVEAGIAAWHHARRCGRPDRPICR